MVEESVYDATGRVVASRTNAEPWTCMGCDIRGRVTSKTVGLGDVEQRTISYSYKVGTNSLKTSTGDPEGTIYTTIDLLGQVTEYVDAKGKIFGAS
jgi:hypothetical protein